MKVVCQNIILENISEFYLRYINLVLFDIDIKTRIDYEYNEKNNTFNVYIFVISYNVDNLSHIIRLISHFRNKEIEKI